MARLLDRLGPEQATGRDVALAGTACAAVAALGVVSLFLRDPGSSAGRPPSQPEAPAPEPVAGAPAATGGASTDVDVFTLDMGDCYVEVDAGLGVVRPEPCSRPHDGELYHRFSVAGTRGGPAFPGNARIEKAADAACTTHFAVFVGTGIDQSAFTYLYWYPDETDWSAGLHDVLCVVVAKSEGQKLDASARGARR